MVELSVLLLGLSVLYLARANQSLSRRLKRTECVFGSILRTLGDSEPGGPETESVGDLKRAIYQAIFRPLSKE